MNERSLVSVKVEPRSTSRLSSALFIYLASTLFTSIKFTCADVRSQNRVSRNQPLEIYDEFRDISYKDIFFSSNQTLQKWGQRRHFRIFFLFSRSFEHHASHSSTDGATKMLPPTSLIHPGHHLPRTLLAYKSGLIMIRNLNGRTRTLKQV